MKRTSAFVLALAACSLVGTLEAQDDRTTPLGVAPGAPAGSYPLSDLERINLFNGSLSFYLPLLTIGGRGEVSHTVGLTIERHWGVMHVSETDPRLVPRFDWWRGIRPGFGPGVMRSYRDFEDLAGVIHYLTRMTFTTPDETQYEFRDTEMEGQPWPNVVEPRGQIFHTSDGAAMTFVSDAPITTAGVEAGRLLFRDGRQYRIDGGLVTSIRDRSGNLMQFQYAGPEQQVSRITDSIGRVYDFVYEGVGGPSPLKKIQFKGFGNTPREIRVEHGPLSTALIDGEQIGTLAELFPEFATAWFQPGLEHHPVVTTRVVLPSGRDYVFRYNRYGELAEVTLPTGGVIEYEHGAGLPGGGSGAFAAVIYRRLVRKTVRPTGGSAQMTTILGPEMSDGLVQTVDEERRGSGDQIISRTRHHFHGQASAELTTDTPLYYPHWQTGREYRTEIYEVVDDVESLLRRVDHTWAQRLPLPGWSDRIANDPRITETTTTLEAGSGLSSKQVFEYDTYNNRTVVKEFAFNAGAQDPPIRCRATDFVTTNGGGQPQDYADLNIHIRDLPKQERLFQSDCTSTPGLRAQTTYEYDNYTPTQGHAALVGRSGIVSLDPAYVAPDQLLTRGNVTATTRLVDAAGSSVTTFQQYDVAGNVVKAIDARGNATTFDFSDRFGAPNNEARGNAPPIELPGLFSYAFATKTVNPKLHETYTQFDYYVGRPVNHENANGVVGSISYNDPLDRPKEVIRAWDHPAKSRTLFAYTDDPPNPVVDILTDKDAFADPAPMHSATIFDGLGREASTRTYEGTGGSDFIVVDEKFYDAAGRLATVRNPYRPSDPGPLYARSTLYDALDRVIGTVTPDGASSTTTYPGNVTIVTDPAFKVRRSTSDALGRVVSVREDPDGLLNHLTSYSYNAFDQVLAVTQDSQQRSFAYDSLGRLICASTPESRVSSAPSCATTPLPTSGLLRYAYDANGNLTIKTDARGVTSAYFYDSLNRVEAKSYDHPQTWQVAFLYDSSSLGKGRLTQSVAFRQPLIGPIETQITNYIEYDALGRITKSDQWAGGSRAFEYTYDLAGNLRTQKYPSGRIVTTTYDVAGRMRSVGQGTHVYAQVLANADYSPHGGLLLLKLGTVPGSPQCPGRWRQTRFNCHLQQRLAGLGCFDSSADLLGIHLGYGTDHPPTGTACQSLPNTPDNNGDLLEQRIDVNNVTRFVQRFTYDGADRLAMATERNAGENTVFWTQSYDYDRWGNRAVTPASYPGPEPGLTPTLLGQFNAANNRIQPPSQYDDAGNQTTDAAGRTFTYDAENRLIAVAAPTGTATYLYDADGRRVRKVVSPGNATTWYVYDAFGRLASEYGPINAGVGTRYLIPDQLGSTRAIVNDFGTVVARSDYLPFGQELPLGNEIPQQGLRADYGTDPSVRHRFTGKERDLETGLDLFGARFMAAAQGRFTTPDPAFVGREKIRTPQKWSRYPYVLNNPLSYVDPDGMEEVTLTYRTFIPNKTVTVLGKAFTGDNRAFTTDAVASHRTAIIVRVETDPAKRREPIIWQSSTAGETLEISSQGNVIDRATASTGLPFATGGRDSFGNAVINIQQAAKNPLSPAPSIVSPAIKTDMNVIISPDASTASVSGSMTPFPAHEAFIDSNGPVTIIYQFKPRKDATPFSLFTTIQVNTGPMQLLPPPNLP